MKDLPQEVLDEIISHLPSGDLHSLQYCSLVAKSWIYPSRRRVFEFIPPLQEATLWSWLNYVSPKNVELLQHVRAISVVIADPLHQRSGAPTDFPHNGSSLFPCLKRLVLYSGTSPSVARLGVSLASQRTLVYLALYRCRLTISTLATLINHFPNLVHLQLLSLYHDVDDDPISALSRPLQNLSANEADYCDEPSVLDQLLELKPQCVGVTISVFPYLAPSLTQRIIDGVEETVKCLNLRVLLRCLHEPLTLANCRLLSELTVWALDVMEPDLISTITSMHIQKITFGCLGNFSEFMFPSTGRDYWTRLDSSLCQLVDRSGYRLRLDVEFRFFNAGEGAGQPFFEDLLPKIHEKEQARVRIVDTGEATVVYCSDRAIKSQGKVPQ